MPLHEDRADVINYLDAKRYQEVKQCIFCGSAEPSLTDEHIIPYALNGNWILPQSSCRSCAKITGSIVEQAVLRGELRHLRAALEFQTRRPAERPRSIRITADDREIEVPINECPILMPFSKFPRAGILDNRPSKPGIDYIGYVMIRWGPDPEEFARQRGIKKLSASTNVAPAMFARMIAKIAYSHAVARFGLTALEEDLITGVIMGKSDRIGDMVGCVPALFPNPNTPNNHILQPVIYKNGEDHLFAIRLKLFADSPSPVYEVVLGRPAAWLQHSLPEYHKS